MAAKEPARPKEPFSLSQAARLVRLGALRAVKFAQRRNAGDDEAKERSPRRKDEIAALLQSLSLDGAARAGLIGEEGGEDDAATAIATNTNNSSASPPPPPPPAAAAAAASTASLITKYRKASTVTSLSLSLSRDGDSGGEAAAERAALVQALVDRYCRVLPWPLEVFVFGGVTHRPSSHLFLCVR
jgi:hypothetical protein